MSRNLWLFIMFFLSTSVFGQGTLRGIVIDLGTSDPIEGANVSLKNKHISVTTSSDGVFIFKNLKSGTSELTITAPGYQTFTEKVIIAKGGEQNLGNIALVKSPVAPGKKTADDVLVFDESALDDDDGASTQSTSYLSGASDDVYLNAAGYTFSPMRFNIRGYNQSDNSTYINGINFNDQERGRFNYSSIGGLNDAFRNKDVINGLEMPAFAYGSIGGATNINTRASAYAAGTKAGVAYTNRSYKVRAMATHSTGLMDNGWAFTASAVFRWANEGIIEGTFYNSWGYFLSAEKVLNERHRISLSTFGAPTKRAQSSAITQEIVDFRSIYYNPYWGYQNGKKRNSRIVHSYDPTAVFNWDFKIDEKSNLKTGVGFHYSTYSNSALAFYNSPDPRPDYYRNMPSFYYASAEGFPGKENWDMINQLTDIWVNNNTDHTQINWNDLYQANYMQNELDRQSGKKSSARYIQERRHNDLMETALNSVYTNQLKRELRLTIGLEAKYTKGMHYKTIDDMLGGQQWIDIDQFSERDFSDNRMIIQNDLNHPDRIVTKGDKFGYDYDMNIVKASIFAANEWNWRLFDLNYALRGTFTTFQRYGNMRNGRAPENSYGAGKSHTYLDPSVKIGTVYKIDGRNRLSLNALAEMRAPLVYNAYVSPRIKDTPVDGLKQEKVISYDLNYNFTFPRIRGRITAFQTHVFDGVETTGYYHDEFHTFINHTLSDVDKVFRGVEAGVSVKLNNSFSVSLAGTFADYRYTSNANGVMSAESGVNLNLAEPVLPTRPGEIVDLREPVYTKNLKVNNGPQAVGSITLDYFHPKMWFADITFTYFGRNYLDFSPSHFTKSNWDLYVTPEQKAILGTQEKLKGGGMLDVSVGKVIYLNNRKQSLNFNLSLSNILNNRDLVTGGYQQGRISKFVDKGVASINSVTKYPNKYYYAWGFNMFFNVGYKF